MKTWTLLIAVLMVAGFHCLAAAAQPESDDPPACRFITALVDESAGLSLPIRVERAFALTLLAANDALHQGDRGKALTLLRTFIFEVRGVKRAQRLNPEAADALVARAEKAIGALGY